MRWEKLRGVRMDTSEDRVANSFRTDLKSKKKGRITPGKCFTESGSLEGLLQVTIRTSLKKASAK